MIKTEDVLTLHFYDYGQAFTGSYRGMRYRLSKQKEDKDEEGNITKPLAMLATVWPEPYSFEKTDDSKKQSKSFEFSDEGKDAAVDWLNEMYAQGQWTVGFRASEL